MNSALIKSIADGITGVLREHIEAVRRAVDELRGELREIPAGASGIGIKAIAQAPDLRSADIELDNGQVIELQLPAGPQGEKGDRGDPGAGIKGDRGDDGQAPSAADVAAVLRASPDFVEAATPQGLRAGPWWPAIHRQGVTVSHYIGRLYCAEKDTTDEPGDSADWARVGTQGLRHVGGFSESRVYQAGDLYAKSGSTFLFDGAQHRLLFQRPYTPADAEKAAKASTKEVADLRAELKSQSLALDDVLLRLHQLEGQR